MITTHDDLDEVIDNIKQQNKLEDKTHPWRICPIGKYFVKKHIVHVPPSKEHPDGETIERHEHCATNSSKKDLLSFLEKNPSKKMEIFQHHYLCIIDGC